jgi:hypothetical protein
LIVGNLVTSIKDFNIVKDQSYSLRVYPNPSTDFIYIEYLNGDSFEERSIVSIKNLLGQELISAKPRGKTLKLNITALPIGSYYLTFEINDKVETYKFIKN